MPHTTHPPFLYVAYHTPKLAICCARNRVHQPDLDAHDHAEAFASVAPKALLLALAKRCRRNNQNGHLVNTVLSDLRFDDAIEVLEDMIEPPEYPPVRQLERIVGAASDALYQRKRPGANAALAFRRGTHKISGAIADKRHRHVVKPSPHHFTPAVPGRQKLDIRVVRQQVITTVLTSADSSNAFALSVPVEYLAAERLSDIPALFFTQRFRRSDNPAQRAAAVAYACAQHPTCQKSDGRRIGLDHHRIELAQCF